MMRSETRRTAFDAAKAANPKWSTVHGAVASRTITAVKERRTGIAGVLPLGSRDTTTDRRGRPYSLVCTKNQASYERRAEQRRRDVKDLALPAG